VISTTQVPEQHVVTSQYNTFSQIPEQHVVTSQYNTVMRIPEQHIATHDVSFTSQVPEQHTVTSQFHTMRQIPEQHTITSSFNTVTQVPETHVKTTTFNTVSQVPETHMQSTTVKLAHTAMVPKTSFTTNFHTLEVPTGDSGLNAGTLSGAGRNAGVRSGAASMVTGDASSLDEPAASSLDMSSGASILDSTAGMPSFASSLESSSGLSSAASMDVGSSSYGRRLQSIPDLSSPSSSYNHAAKPYTVVAHLVCKPSTYTSYKCPSCDQSAQSSYGSDSVGSWLSPAESGAMTHIYHHVYHAASDTPAMGFGEVEWKHSAGGFTAAQHPEWQSVHFNGESFVPANRRLLEVGDLETPAGHTNALVGLSAGVGVAALVALVAANTKKNGAAQGENKATDIAEVL
jgi:hypothetical protein